MLWTLLKKIKSLPNDSHYDSDAHKIIFNDYIHPQLKELITITTKII
jgi:hypothetical protein